jgi:hypothetical protein
MAAGSMLSLKMVVNRQLHPLLLRRDDRTLEQELTRI